MVSTSFVAAAFGALPLAFAQNYYPAGNATQTYAPAPSGTGSPSAAHTVTVGANQELTFVPDTIIAAPGEDIVFQFFPKNHSVVQSEFDNPCNPSDGGIFSGFIPTPPPGPSNTTFTITVSDDKPIWLYCAQNQPKPHCAAGMVAVINPPKQGPNTLDAFKQLAAGTTGSTAPAGGPSGGKVGTPGSPGTPGSGQPSGTGSGNPAQSTGGASTMAASGALGLMAAFAGLLL